VKTRSVYDDSNRLIWTVDAVGGVTQFAYDHAGRLEKKTQYATAIAYTGDPATVVRASNDRVTLYGYDSAGRAVVTVDALGGVSQVVFDAKGNAVQRIAYGTRVAAPTVDSDAKAVTSAALTVLGGTSDKRINWTFYDAADRAVYSVDAEGGVVETEYDLAGEVVATTRYGKALTAAELSGLSTGSTVQSLTALRSAKNEMNTLPTDRTTLQTFDALGRLSCSVDGEGYARKLTYDGMGRVLTSTLCGLPTTGLTRASTREQIDAEVNAKLTQGDSGPGHQNKNEVDRFTYDAVGRLWQSFDALDKGELDPHFEEITYDGVGRKTSFTSKKSAVWSYTYDAAGRLVQEEGPPVDVWGFGATQATNLRIKTVLEYDGLGNLKKRTEASGIAGQQRATEYDYDVHGRQIATRVTGVGVYSESLSAVVSNGTSGAAARIESTLTLQSTVRYDVLGNAVSGTDVAGAVSYKAFDKLGQVRYEVDALGFVTAYERNAYGDVTAVTRYAERPALTATQATSVSAIEAALLGLTHAKDRTITTTYDRLGRAKTVVQPQVWMDFGDGTTGYYSPTTENVYDAFGQLHKQRVLANAVTSAYAETTHQYDRRGLETTTTDALGHVTQLTYDSAAGNLTEVTELDPTGDRKVRYEYDLANRKTKEIRVGIRYTDASGTPGVIGNVATDYLYDAVGNLETTTDARGAVTRTYYDALGRILRVDAPARGTGVPTVSLSPVTVFRRDAFGNVVEAVGYAKDQGALNATPVTDKADRHTLTQYDVRGNAIRIRELEDADTAEYVDRYMSYDAAGRLAKQWQDVYDLGSPSGPKRTFFAVFQYDALGHQTMVVTPASTNVVSGGTITTQTQAQSGYVLTCLAYNGFGEMVSRSNAATGEIKVGTSGADTTATTGAAGSQFIDGGAGADTIDGASGADILIGGAGNDTYKVTYGSGADRIIETDTTAANSDCVTFTNVPWSSVQAVQRIGDDLVVRFGATDQITIVNQWRPDGSFAIETFQFSGSTYGAAYMASVATRVDTWQTQGDVEYYDYDNAGRLWRTNQGDGNVKVKLYNLLGQQTAEIASDGSFDLKQLGSAEFVSSRGSGSGSGVRRTTFLRDLLGRVTQQVLPLRNNGTAAAPLMELPYVVQTYDRWGNVLSQRDASSGAFTYYTYDTNNQVTSVVQPTEGGVSGTGPRTDIEYDELGRQVAITTPERFSLGANLTTKLGVTRDVNRQVWDAAGQLVQETHADGGVVKYEYDAFGNRTSATDARGNRTEYTYDHSGRVKTVKTAAVDVWSTDGLTASAGLNPVQLQSTTTYDSLGNKRKVVNGAGEITTYQYDLKGNVVLVSGPGQWHSSAYDALGKQVGDLDGAGGLSTWSYDAFGQLRQHRDLGGADYTFTYDFSRQLLQQTNSRGQNLAYVYDGAGQLVQITDSSDATKVKTTTYQYNRSGLRVTEKTVVGATTYQNQVSMYDALGRLQHVTTWDGIDIQYKYDGVGNRLYQETDYNTITGTESGTKKYWFAYDSMNRQILVDGAVDGDATNWANITNSQGHFLAYDKNGNRVADTFWGTRVVRVAVSQIGSHIPVEGEYEGGGGGPSDYTHGHFTGVVSEFYSYDGMDRLKRIATGALKNGRATVGQEAMLTDERGYDAASRVISVGPTEGLPSDYLRELGTTEDSDANGARRRITKYDAQGRVLTQRTLKPDGSLESLVTYSRQVFDHYEPGYYDDELQEWIPGPAVYRTEYGYDSAGNVTWYRSSDSNNVITNYTRTLTKYEGYLEATLVSERVTSGGSDWATGTNAYDKNGLLVAVTDSGQAKNNRQFVNDANGVILQKDQGWQTSQSGWNYNTLRQVVSNGNVIGTYGEGSDPVKPSKDDGTPNIVNQSTFDATYRAITSSYPVAGTGTYPVHAGDTLTSIAQAAYGDSSFWYLIAGANGLRGDGDLRAGQIITIPTRASGTRNSADTYRPYDPSALVGGSAATPKGPGCDAFKTVLIIAVTAIVSTALTPAGGGILGAAIGGALGSSAGQLTAMALGVQEKFSWKQVGMTALQAGVTAGVSQATESLGVTGWADSLKGFSKFAANTALTAAKAAASNAGMQGLRILLTKDDHWSWRSVAATSLGAAAGAVTAGAVNLTPAGSWANENSPLGWATRFTTGVLSATAAGVTTKVSRGGRMDVQQVVTDAFGNAIANTLGSTIGDAINTQLKNAYELSQVKDEPIYAEVPEATPVGYGGADLPQPTAFYRPPSAASASSPYRASDVYASQVDRAPSVRWEDRTDHWDWGAVDGGPLFEASPIDLGRRDLGVGAGSEVNPDAVMAWRPAPDYAELLYRDDRIVGWDNIPIIGPMLREPYEIGYGLVTGDSPWTRYPPPGLDSDDIAVHPQVDWSGGLPRWRSLAELDPTRQYWSDRLMDSSFQLLLGTAPGLYAPRPIPWGEGIGPQGYAFERILARDLPPESVLPRNFKTFDFKLMSQGELISAKTLDLRMPGYLEPNAVFNAVVNDYGSSAASFTAYKLSGVRVDGAKFLTRSIDLAVPPGGTAAQWLELRDAARATGALGVQLRVRVVAPPTVIVPPVFQGAPSGSGRGGGW